MMATGELRAVRQRSGRWGESSVLEACDDALALDGVNCGDFLVVDRGSLPDADDALVVVERSAPRRPGAEPTSRLFLRKLERIGAKVSLQPGSSPRRVPYVLPESAGIWGTVVAVMRKFEAA